MKINKSLLCFISAIIMSLSSVANGDSFFESQKKGANIFNRQVSQKLIKQAKSYGIEFIRLAPDKFITKNRDFLIGNADSCNSPSKDDLDKLKTVLDICAKEGMPVVLVMLSLPGSRWKQNNNNNDDLRLWQSDSYINQAAKFWHDVAAELKNHPSIVGYDILNEPHSERLYDLKSASVCSIEQEKIQDKLNQFNKKIVSSIREVDLYKPIIVESSGYADPRCFAKLKPIEDDNIIYSFHMYEPFNYTNYKQNNGKYRYPGPIMDLDTKNIQNYDIETLGTYFEAVSRFQLKYNIASSKILVGEFGGHRMSDGLEHYFNDLILIFNKHNWHWAVYSFREDVWDGMDYEIGTKKLSWQYWQAIEQGKNPAIPYNDNPIFRVLLDQWRKKTF